MNAVIKQAIEKHVMAYQKSNGKCVAYSTKGISEVAEELDISFEAANELVRSWIDEEFR